ncbi:Gfo/Idh/MocA family protein [Armatimonas rosea]|uniref:Putative dehydrogenase n=1 Tax=Armatimonas rosea TaxID=685828 RepID=A0A7W9SQ13_ARMRO|nr:Gfo/Idh/MocA family oxidoreductase [Armatimonas rosea]MBB6050350.1 putative dehydrogenase [Armatimonas rosea]
MNQALSLAVIGAGERGKEILAALSLLPEAVVKYVCDSYSSPLFQKKALENAPKATFVNDYKKVLDDKTVQGVFVATPTHLHKQIVLDALAAGKHVFCEAPLAHTIEDARAIALAGKNSKQLFQVGLQNRSNPQHRHVKYFVDTGVLGNVARAEATWNKKASWRRAAPTPEREAALNWRLNPGQANGLLGEVGIHQLDTISWFLKESPLSVASFGNENSVTAIVQFPRGIQLTYNATLGSSFGGGYELLCGDQTSMLLRGTRAWMIKESDAPVLGWEVYTKREPLGDETGYILVASASKLLSEGLEPSRNLDTNPRHTPLFFACEGFLNSMREGKPTGRTSASAPNQPHPMHATAEAGFAATVVGIRANEAVKTGKKITNLREESTL